MEEIGTVISSDGYRAKVSVGRSEACGHCKAKDYCQTGQNGKLMITEANNPLGAKVGDRVKISMEGGNVLSAAFLVYILPLIAMIVGYILGNNLAMNFGFPDKAQLYGILGGVLFIVGSFAFVHFYDKRARAKGKFRGEIKGIVNQKGGLPNEFRG